MGNVCSDKVANVPDNSLTTLTVFVFTMVAVFNAWAFKYIPQGGKRKKVLGATTGGFLGDQGIDLFANTFLWAVAYVFFYGAAFWFLFSVHNQCKWEFFLFVSLFGLSKILDAFVWPYFYFKGDRTVGLVVYSIGWIADLAILVIWPIANFGGVAVHADASFGSFNLAFGIIGLALFFLWLIFRGYVFYNLYFYADKSGGFAPLIKR